MTTYNIKVELKKSSFTEDGRLFFYKWKGERRESELKQLIVSILAVSKARAQLKAIENLFGSSYSIIDVE